ncbi:MAG: hypothetical protein HYW79_00950 [Parcubacteria group bacterium]|nr:hypothetical protein [Parcubacteria group bacterium]
MKPILQFLKINILLFLILNALSYIVAATFSGSFFIPLQNFFFPYIFCVFGFVPVSLFGLIFGYLWLYFCFWADGEITDEMGAAFFEFFIFVVSVVSTIAVFRYSDGLSIVWFLRDIWIGFFLASLINAEKGERYYKSIS